MTSYTFEKKEIMVLTQDDYSFASNQNIPLPLNSPSNIQIPTFHNMIVNSNDNNSLASLLNPSPSNHLMTTSSNDLVLNIHADKDETKENNSHSPLNSVKTLSSEKEPATIIPQNNNNQNEKTIQTQPQSHTQPQPQPQLQPQPLSQSQPQPENQNQQNVAVVTDETSKSNASTNNSKSNNDNPVSATASSNSVTTKITTVDLLTSNELLNRWGQIRSSNKDPSNGKKNTLSSKQKKEKDFQDIVDREREVKWLEMLAHWELYIDGKRDKLKERIRKGIPDSLRAVVWPKLTKANEYLNSHKGEYNLLLTQTSELEDVISRDINRTFPDHVFFRAFYQEDQNHNSNDNNNDNNEIPNSAGSAGRSSLFRVLKAYSLVDKQVGYCQGMGFITGIFLMYMGEEEAFGMMHSIMRGSDLMLAGIYQPFFPLMKCYFWCLEQLLKTHASRLYSHFNSMGIPPDMYATQWFITLFSYNFPFEVVLRIWDILFFEGIKIIFRVAIYLAKSVEKNIITQDFENTINIIKDVHNLPIMSNADLLIKNSLAIPLKRSEINKLVAKYEAEEFKKQREQAAGKSKGKH